MKNNLKLFTIIFLSFILIVPMAFVFVPTAKASSLQSFTISPDPSAVPLLVGHSYDFTLTATLPGGSGSNGVDVYVLPQAGEVGTTGVTISYTDIGYGIYPVHIPPNGNSASVNMTIIIPSDAIPGPLPLTVTAYDNPGGGGTIIGSFTATLHVNEISLTVQTSGLSSATNVYIGGSKVGTAYDGVPYGPAWYELDPATGTVTIGAIGVDNNVYGTAEYFFSSWADSTSNPHPPITTSDSVTLTAYYVTKSAQITITSNPTGSNFISVDSTPYSSPHTFTWAVGSTHTLQALSPIAGASGTQYVYNNWNDSGAQTHSYIVASTNSATITANYKTQYSVAFAVNPTGAGSTNPTEGTSVWSTIGTLPISATANPGYHFDHWSSSTGSITFTDSTLASTTATINAPGTLTANFAFNPVTHFAVEASSPITAGSSLQVKVAALDADGNTIAGYTGTVQITSSDPQAVLPNAAQLTNGVGYFTVILKTAGSQSITATDQADFTITGSTNVMVNADSSSINLVVSAPSSATAGVPFTLTVTAEDLYGNTVTGYAGTVHFTSTDNSAILPSDYTFQASDLGSKAFDGVILITEGVQTITATDTVTSSITGTTAGIIVTGNPDQPKTIIVSPPSAAINAGDSQTFNAELFDIYGNSLGEVTNQVTWSIDVSAGGSWDQATGTYTSAKASPGSSPWTITASLNDISGYASLTVTHAINVAYLDHITASVNPTTIAAPNTATATATAYDSFGNSWDITTQAVWSIPTGNDGGSWTGNIYTSKLAGTYAIQASYQGKTATASLTVTHSTDQSYLDHIVISPKESTVGAGVFQTYTATAYDTFGNSWTVNAVYSCPNSNVNISSNSVGSNIAGSYIITGSYSGKSDTATLNVTANPALLDRITISPTSSIITSGNSQSYKVEAFDQYNNDLGDVTSASTFSVNGIPISGHTVTQTATGYYIITANYNGKTATATLHVLSAPSDSPTTPAVITYAVTFTENGLPAGQSWNITLNGVTRSSNQSTIVFNNIPKGSYSWTALATIAGATDTQYTLSVSNGTINVPSQLTINSNYTTQYYLTITSAYGNPTGAGWYNANTTATFSVDTQAKDTSGSQYGFNGWTGTGNGSYTGDSNIGTVTMTSPITEIANWEQATSLYLYLLVLLIILAIIAALLYWRRRRQTSENNPTEEESPA